MPFASKISARLVVEPLATGPLTESLLLAAASQDRPAILESSAFHADWGRYTILACCPLEVLSLKGEQLIDSAGTMLAKGREQVWQALDAALSMIDLAGTPQPAGLAPYTPGWIGYVGYEVGRLIERLPGRSRSDTSLPDLHLAFYDAILIFDAMTQQSSLVRLEFAKNHEEPAGKLLASAGHGANILRGLVQQATAQSPNAPPVTRLPNPGTRIPPARSNFTPDEYREAVKWAVDYIAAGDIFQVNLSQRFVIDPAPGPQAIYRALRRRNPSWYGAYIGLDAQGTPPARARAVVSSSPELFLRVRGRHLLTRPIKGTRPRVGDDAADAQARNELWNSHKDNAELAMIIDLLRNDLGRVCEYGSVHVTQARTLEEHPTVYHLVGSVEGTLRRDVRPAEILRATFPGGSITGAPKIRAMEIIDELEHLARGVYCGCMGIVGANGDCEWNIAIRTVICDGRRAYAQAGGGIVADSTPEGEYQETLDKARALIEAVQDARRGQA